MTPRLKDASEHATGAAPGFALGTAPVVPRWMPGSPRLVDGPGGVRGAGLLVRLGYDADEPHGFVAAACETVVFVRFDVHDAAGDQLSLT